MDTGKLKRFATEARKILMQGVAHRLSALGFQPDGTNTEEPQQQGGGATFMGKTVSQDFYDKWQSLRHAVGERGIRVVAEEAAYTWFNRLVAIRIMAKNGLASPVVEYESEEVPIPLLVSEARQGRMPEMDADSRSRLDELLDDDSKTSEQFAILIVAYCHENPIIHQCFGRITDYTELLLPTNILNEGGFVRMLNQTEFIADEDYRSPELIGWLYQFYIAERKDEVFAKKGKFEADEIPAATQIFTPNWIVKYMVQNTIGRIYLDNNPYEQHLAADWNYLVDNLECTKEEEQPTTDNEAQPIINSKLSIINYSDLEELKIGDLACGSGHILNECFDLLFQLYMAEGYGRTKAIENIFRHNLTGIDLDTRAKQLAQFALLLKACQKDPTFADGHCLPRVLDMPAPEDNLNRFFGVFMHDMDPHSTTLVEAVKLCAQARTLGSIMKFNITEQDRHDLSFCIQRWEQEHASHPQNNNPNDVAIARLILALTEKYHALVMNPPYMYSSNMPKTLLEYVNRNYDNGRTDLCASFMRVAQRLLVDNGKYSMINMQSWMFLTSFFNLRKSILTEVSIDSLLHLGARTFDELSGEVVQSVAFTITNCKPSSYSICYRLVDGTSTSEKERLFLSHKDENYIIDQNSLKDIPGNPFAYWASPKVINAFNIHKDLNTLAYARVGMFTGDNNRFLREWWEISSAKLSCHTLNNYSSIECGKKWFGYNKGGGYKKWYGNLDLVVNYQNGGYDIFELSKQEKRNCQNYPDEYKFREGITWTGMASDNISFRFLPNGCLFDSNKGPVIYTIEGGADLVYILAFLNTIVCNSIANVLNPTLSKQINDILNIPLANCDTALKQLVMNLAQDCVDISKQDWDAHETSWDFETNPLLAVDTETYIDNINHEIERHEKETGERICIDPAPPQPDSLEWRMEQYKQKWEHLFMQLHENEEELNRQFINIYGLQDELTPDVPLNEITILQQGEVTIE